MRKKLTFLLPGDKMAAERVEIMELFLIFKTALDAVAPIILLILMGYILRQKGFLSENFLQVGNKLVFKLMLPCMLFCNVYSIGSLAQIQWDVTLYALAAILVIFGLGLATAVAVTPVPQRRGVVLQCTFRSNYAIIGMPLAAALGGPASEGMAALLSAVSIPLFNILAVIALTVFVGKKESFGKSAANILRGIVTNPLIISVCLGLVCLGLRWAQTELWGEVRWTMKEDLAFVYGALNTLKNGTTPLALLVLGGQFVFSAVKELKREIVTATLWRVVLAPVIGVGGAIVLSRAGLLHCTQVHYPALVALFGSPVAVSSAIMAKGMGGDEQLATQLVVWTTLCSGVTVFLLVCGLMGMGYIGM